MIEILCDAVAFCYGPISTLDTTIKYFRSMCGEQGKENNIKITLLACGSSLELANSGLYDTILECNTESEKELEKYKYLFKNSHIFINDTNPVSARYAAQFHHLSLVYIDILFWMWPDIPSYLENADYYFIEDFTGVTENIDRIGRNIKNPIIVGPILDESFREAGESVNRRENKLLVSFGGIESALTQSGINTNYPYFVTEILLKSLEIFNPFDTVIISGGKKAMDRLRLKYNRPGGNIFFDTLPHGEFLKELSTASKVVASPGLTTAYEIFAYQVPVMFLPSQNYSQYLQLEKFRELKLAPYSFDWCDVMTTGIDEYEHEEKAVRKVLECITTFENHETMHTQLENKLTRFYREKNGYFRPFMDSQTGYMKSLGCNGAVEMARRLVGLIDGPG